MNLYERCTDLGVKLEAAQAADSSAALLASGTNLADRLDQASQYFAGAARLRSEAGIVERPPVDVKAMLRAVNAFRGALSSRKAAAFQQQYAANLTEIANKQREVAARWVLGRWKGLFSNFEAQMVRAREEALIGSATQQAVARSRAQTLFAAMGLDPILRSADLKELLGGDAIAVWMQAIHSKSDELNGALYALDTERAGLSAEVNEALRRATTGEGLPLSELSTELLHALRAAGVDDYLAVKRR
jgi:hypothetical protein